MGQSFWWEEQDDAHPAPVPLVEDMSVIEQPINLATITQRYTDRIIRHIQEFQGIRFSWSWRMLMYISQIIVLLSKCGDSRRGPYGDSVEEVDDSCRR
eukprot:TRINITY_DN11387_c0_g1_i1.p1 TRINITY_DN11387_c0_g1~~TRINITY_DN11387_c0_g1_i1.p1  ORF type:complete len:98 (-),score=14.63 TRINITY_DN11387_c0_g1_i1:256-549(-)